MRNDTWELKTLHERDKAIGTKWVYMIKRNYKGEMERYKTRIVIKGCRQSAGIDYNEVFVPIVYLFTIRLIISLEAQTKWKIYQMDVKLALLNGYLAKEVYIEQPSGDMEKRNEHTVLKLKKSLHDIKQAPMAWFSCIDKYF